MWWSTVARRKKGKKARGYSDDTTGPCVAGNLDGSHANFVPRRYRSSHGAPSVIQLLKIHSRSITERSFCPGILRSVRKFHSLAPDRRDAPLASLSLYCGRVSLPRTECRELIVPGERITAGRMANASRNTLLRGSVVRYLDIGILAHSRKHGVSR